MGKKILVPASYPEVSLRCARKGRREGDNGRGLPSVPFPWSLAVHHQSLAFRARLCHAKNEAPEEEAVLVPCLDVITIAFF